MWKIYLKGKINVKKVQEVDAKTLYDTIFNNFKWHKYYSQKPFNSFEEYEESLKRLLKYYENGNHFRWRIHLKDMGRIIGQIQLHTKDYINDNCNLGCIASYNEQKKGYAKEAIQKVISFAFTELPFHRIEGNICLDNLNSIHLAVCLGMTFESIKK